VKDKETGLPVWKPFVRERSLYKGYKMVERVKGAPDVILCDKCFADSFRTVPYEYGCGDDFHGGYENVQPAIEVMYLTNKLRNAWVEIDRYDRTEYRRLTTDPELEVQLAPLDTALLAIRDHIQEEKKRQRTRKPQLTSEVIQAKKDLLAQRRPIYKALKEARTRLAAVNRAALTALKAETDVKMRKAYDDSPLPWTIKDPLIARFRTSSAQAKKNGTMPKKHRFNGTGIITVPYTNGLSLAKAYSGTGKFQIATTRMSDHPRERRTQCKIAIGPTQWLTLPVVFHRPPVGEIRGVTVKREILAGKARWKLVIAMRVSDVKTPSSTLACGIDVGYRKRPDGSIRVACIVGEDGHTEELLFPVGDMAMFHVLDGLKAVMAKRFNDIRNTLAEGIRTLPSAQRVAETQNTPTDHSTVSEPLRDALAFIGLWKSPGRLVKAMRIWRENRFEGDEALFGKVEQWYYGVKPKPSEWNGHLHLYRWFINLSDRLQCIRRERYRVFVAELVKRYGIIYLEDFDLRGVIQTPEPEDAEYDDEARYQRSKVAVSVLRAALHSVCLREGNKLQKVDPAFSTHECPDDGTFIEFDAARNLTCQCPSCGKEFDQDFLAAEIILKRGRASGLAPAKTGVA
jgi:hypothetical protein